MFFRAAVCVTALIPVIVHAAPKTPTQGVPKLFVVLVVDQMKGEYLQTLRPIFGKEGFLKLSQNGAYYANAHHEHVPTFTAPGHATIATGTVPHFHGIVSNSWYERSEKRVVDSVADSNTKLLMSPNVLESAKNNPLAKSDRTGSSPHRLQEMTFSDRLKEVFGGKSVGISLKARSAILSVGKNADVATWFDSSSGSFVSSTYYGDTMPQWLNKFNDEKRAFSMRGKTWDLLLPRAQYGEVFDLNKVKFNFPFGIGFPKKFEGSSDIEIAQRFEISPAANSAIVDLGLAAIDGEGLGKDSKPDVLVVSFSTPDLVGHAYSPSSLELKDIMARLDRDVAHLLKQLEKRVGKDFVLALSADHGVAPLVEEAASKRQSAIRVNAAALVKSVQEKLNAEFGEAEWIENVSNDQIFFNLDTLKAKKVDLDRAVEVAGQAAIKNKGVKDYYRLDLGSHRPSDDLGNRIANGNQRPRSGEVFVVLEPLAYFEDKWVVTTHGSGYAYDTHVPVVLYGKGIKKGVHMRRAAPMDIVPTFSALAGINPPPSVVGKVLVEVLQ